MSNKMTRSLSVLLTLISLIALWELLCWVLDIPKYLLPTPIDIIQRIFVDWGMVVKHSGVTLVEIFAGFGLSIIIGIPFAVVVVYSKYFSQAFFPILIGLQCIPMVSLAPLLIVWFGFGMLSKVLIAFLISFFPILVNTIAGLKSMEKDMFMLSQSLRANSMQVFLYFRLPKALPSIFAGFKVGITLAVVGAVVAEFVSSERGLGYLQLIASSQLDVTLQFCVIVALAVIGLGLYNLVALIERISIPWYKASRGGE